MTKEKKIPKTKVCTKCGVRKKLDRFINKKNSKYGKAAYCKNCNSIYMSKYYSENKAAAKSWGVRYRIINNDKIKKLKQKYYQNNKEYCDYKSSIWAKNNRIKRRYIANKYVKKNQDKINLIKRLRTEKLNDIYIKDLLRQSGIKNPHPSMIRIKRAHIKLFRAIKQVSKINN